MTTMVNRVLISACVAAILAGCDQESGPDPDIHDTKYVAIGPSGETVGIESGRWPCVLDQYTGLVWETKTDGPGLHQWQNTYTWYDPDEAHDQGLDYRGVANGGTCTGSDCDSYSFAQAVNDAGYCGYHDWRIPERDELGSISDLRKIKTPPTINSRYFPFTQPEEYWSANDYSFQWDSAWTWNFRFGHDRVDWKKTPKPVRLVRGEAVMLEKVDE
jgi:hypothetical protein